MIRLFYRIINRCKRVTFRFTWKRAVLILALLLVFFYLASQALFYFEKRNWDNRPGEINPKLKFMTFIPNVTNSWNFYNYLLPSNLPKYQLVVGGKEMKKLAAALPKDFFGQLPEDDVTVPATFIAEGKKYKVKIKNRGQMSRHWQYREKSWSVKFTDEYFHGYKELYFVIPEEKDFLVEEFGNHLAGKLGLITVDSYFARLKVNNQSYGAYWVTEGWNNDFLERHNLSSDANLYREGKDIEPRIYQDSVNWDKYTSESHSDAASWEKYKDETHSQVSNFADLDLLVGCLNKCSDREFYELADKIIDLDNFLRWQAHTAIMGDDHQDSWHNARVYFDPIVGKFKFFPWDVNVFQFGGQLDVVYNPLVSKLLTYPDLLHKRNQIIWDYINEADNVKDDLNYYQGLYQQTKSAFYRDREKRISNWYFDYQVSDRLAKIKGQYEYLRTLLQSDTQDGGKKKVQIKVYNFDNRVAKFQILVNSFSDLAVNDVSAVSDLADCAVYYDADQNGVFNGHDKKVSEFSKNRAADRWQTGDLGVQLFARRELSEPLPYEQLMPVKLTPYTFFIVSEKDRGLSEKDLDFNIANAVTGQQLETDLRFYDLNVFSRIDDISLTASDFVKKNGNFINRGGQELLLPAGTHIFEKTAVIPKNLTLRIAAGARLSFAAGASLISYSPIIAEGDKSNPIIFQPLIPGQSWGVVGVVGTDSRQSVFKHCVFSGGKDLYLNGIYFSGQLSLHQSDVEIENCVFSEAAADDSLHVAYAKGTVKSSKFLKNSSDAIDFDYCQGEISGSYFEANGNDAVDLSGTAILVRDNLMVLSGDKGVSIGEKSSAQIVGNTMAENNIGVEVKDNSTPILINNTIVKNNIGINEYRKKELYVDGGKADVYNTIIWDNKDQIVLDRYSLIKVNNSLIQGGWQGSGGQNADLPPNFKNPDAREYLATNSELKKYVNYDILKQYQLSDYDNLGIGANFFINNIYFSGIYGGAR